jgi:hypothetical protein
MFGSVFLEKGGEWRRVLARFSESQVESHASSSPRILHQKTKACSVVYHTVYMWLGRRVSHKSFTST